MSALDQIKDIIERAFLDEVELASIEISSSFASSLAYDFITFLSFDDGKGKLVEPTQEILFEGLIEGPNQFGGVPLVVVPGQEEAAIARKKVVH